MMQGGRRTRGRRTARHKVNASYLPRLLGSPESRILLTVIVSLILIGPLRDALSTVPLLPFLGTVALFMAPGMIVSYLVPDHHFSGAARIPIAFVLSAGMFGLLAVAALVLHWSLQAYLLVCGGVLVTCAVLAIAGLLRGRPASENKLSSPVNPSDKWLWASFLLLGAVLAFVSTLIVLGSTGDIWVYFSHIREFLYTGKLGLYEPFYGDPLGASRVRINGWLLEQAAFSRLSGIDPIALTLKYLAPALVFIALLAFYALAKTLLRNRTAALLAGSLFALFLLVYLDPSPQTEGGMFVSRITEDKFVARYIFLPVALSLAALFLRGREIKHLVLFAFTCWAVMVMHPVGLAIIGLSAAGFSLIHVMVNWRERGAWAGATGLGAALLSVALAPVAYALVIGSSLLSVRKSAVSATPMDEAVSMGAMVLVSPGTRLLQIGEGLYIMHPSLLNSVVLSAYLLGVPFLLWHVKRSLAAQLLLGVLLLVALLLYFPPIATLLVTYAGPGQLWRLAWPIPLAALLTVSWMLWKLMEPSRFFPQKDEGARSRVDMGSGRREVKRTMDSGSHATRYGAVRRVAPFLPVLFVVVSTAVAAPWIVAKIGAVQSSNGEKALGTSQCSDPTFSWMQDVITAPSMVLAQGGDNNCIAAHVAPADVVATTGQMGVARSKEKLEQTLSREIKVPQRAMDAQEFFVSRTPEKMTQVLRRYKVDYVVTLATSPIDKRLQDFPGLAKLDNPGERYHVYKVSSPGPES